MTTEDDKWPYCEECGTHHPSSSAMLRAIVADRIDKSNDPIEMYYVPLDMALMLSAIFKASATYRELKPIISDFAAHIAAQITPTELDDAMNEDGSLKFYMTLRYICLIVFSLDFIMEEDMKLEDILEIKNLAKKHLDQLNSQVADE